MRFKQVRLITIASAAVILLTMPRASANGSTRAPSSHCEASLPQTGEAIHAVSRAADRTTEDGWPMAAANPERTSWSPEEVKGRLSPVWYQPIDPYISYKTQVIAANGLLYISTARGLYALEAATGELAWVYPTELPLGQSPTVEGDTLYVGGYDKRIHAVDAVPDADTLATDPETGYKVNERIVWTFDAQEHSHGLSGGFETNPLVVNGTVFAGNRDGCMYAVDADDGSLVWKYETGGPIRFSAAYADGAIYFASNDSHAYALDARDGSLVWKSAKLPGAGFHSYWPVVYRNYVVFAGTNNYRIRDWRITPELGMSPGKSGDERDELYPNRKLDPKGTLIGPEGTEPGDWVSGTVTIDVGTPNCTENGCTKPITEYFEKKPWRRTIFVLDRFTGDEFTFDSDEDGNSEYAPFAWFGTGNGNRYPPVVGSDGVLYQGNTYMSDEYIPGGQAVGWKFGTAFISRVSSDWHAVDEQPSYSAGGDLVYWTNCCDREAGAYDITIPYGSVPNSHREWKYFDYNLDQKIPEYYEKYYGYYSYHYYPSGDNLSVYGSPSGDNWGVYGSINGVYGAHNVQNPVVPYRGHVYLHRSNAVIAFGDTTEEPVQLPPVATIDAQEPPPGVTTEQLKAELAAEVEKMLDAGHLRPGYYGSGMADHKLGSCLVDYFHNPADTIYTLLRTLPHLSPDLQQETRQYLQQEFSDYPPYEIAHIGWRDGAAREVFDLPPEIEAQRDSYGAQTGGTADWWNFPQHSFYALWKYAQEFGGAVEIFGHVKNKLEMPPNDDYLAENPHVHNSYIAGYVGYLGLKRMAEGTKDSAAEAELNRLLELRATNFTKDSPFGIYHDVQRVLNVARNFMYLVPELADYLHDNALAKVHGAIDEYNEVAPCWFVSKYDSTFDEGTFHPLYDYHSMFQAKALILEESREELVKCLDVPAFERGDLFYIQNLVAAIEAPYGLEKNVTLSSAHQGSQIIYTLSFSGRGITHTLNLTDTLPAGMGTPTSFELEGTTVTPTYDSDQHLLTWSDAPAVGKVTIRYATLITTGDSQVLENTAELGEAGGELSVASTAIIANPKLIHMPLIFKDGWWSDGEH